MKARVKISETAGKTVERLYCTGYDTKAFLVFTDGTFAALSAEAGYEGDCTLEEAGPLNAYNYRLDLVRAGVMTQEESREMEAAEHQRTTSAREHYERAMYERLKAKFGSGA